MPVKKFITFESPLGLKSILVFCGRIPRTFVLINTGVGGKNEERGVVHN